jgi:hypothetical protein
MSIIAFYLGCPFRVVLLSSLSLSRKFEAKFPHNFQEDRIFLPALAKAPPGTQATACNLMLQCHCEDLFGEF